MGLYSGGLNLSEGFLRLRFGGLFSGGLIILAGGLIIGILWYLYRDNVFETLAIFTVVEGHSSQLFNLLAADALQASNTSTV